MAGVELRSLSKRYGDVAAVDGISLDITHGEFLALLGPSGCGKTTTLQLIAGFIEPTAGDILIDGRSLLGVPPHKRNIGVVFQSYALFPHLSVLDNVAFGLRMRKVERSEIAARVRRALDMVQLSALEDRFPRALSGGQQQRVALARALVIEPTVLLLDEPLSNLDANLREQMRFEIREIQRRIAITTVFVTHDQGEAMAAADRLVVMSQGTIRQVGTAREIYERPVDAFVARFIGQANLLHGHIGETDGAWARLDLAALGSVRAHQPDRLAPGAPAALALRPEDLRISNAPVHGENSLAGTLVRVNFLGASQHAAVRCGDVVLAVSRPRSEEMPAEGSTVHVHWPADRGVLLEAGPSDQPSRPGPA